MQRIQSVRGLSVSEKEYCDIELNKMSVDELLKIIDNPDVGHYILCTYRERLKQVSVKKRPETAILIANSLLEQINDRTDEKENYIRCYALTNITRIGMNAFYSRNIKDGFYKPFDILEMDTIVRLYYLNSLGMEHIGRPIKALFQNSVSTDYCRQFENECKTQGRMNDKIEALFMEKYNMMFLSKARILEGIVPDINSGSRKMVADYISYSYYILKDYYLNHNDKQMAEDLNSLHHSFVKSCEDFDYQFDDKEYFKKFCNQPIPNTGNYAEWCWNNRLWLNIASDVLLMDKEQLKDDIDLKVDIDNTIRMNEIVRTFDHCRSLFYQFSKAPFEERAYYKPGPETEFLVDCYYRLFSLLDKIAKVISCLLFGNSKYIQSFKDVCIKLKPGNNYIGGIFRIYRELFFSDEDLKDGIVDEFNSAHRVKRRTNFIRNMIAHSALNFVTPDEDYNKYKGYDNVLTLSAADLENETVQLFHQIREILMNLQLAVNSGEVWEFKENH